MSNVHHDSGPDAGLFDLPGQGEPSLNASTPAIPAPRAAPDHPAFPTAPPDVWRVSGRGVVAFPDYSPDTCSRDHGLCGVCVGARCENALAPEVDDEHPEDEPDDQEPEA